MPYIRPCITSSPRPVIPLALENPWATYPMRRRTSDDCVRRSRPQTRASPAVGVSSVTSIRNVVVLPAPFGPRKPKTWPVSTRRSTPRTASTAVSPLPKLLRNPVVSMIAVTAVVLSAIMASCGALFTTVIS